MADDICIRRCATIADYEAIQAAQRLAWGLTEDSYVVPIATLVGAQLHGGLVLGAFRPDGTAAGLSFAFLGQIGGRLGLYSQLTGVVPGHQGQGLGERLKQAQRDAARAGGLPVIAWAFDPLQAGNAHFNLERLGAVGTRYVVDMYGRRTDALNASTPTDRLIAEWETEDQPAVATRAEPADAPFLVEAVGADQAPRCRLERLAGRPLAVRVEIPPEIGRLRKEAPEGAAAWTEALRGAFPAALAAGYRASGFMRWVDAAGKRCAYRLTRALD
jgi:predicted GNAT superfamily acetyltransferase